MVYGVLYLRRSYCSNAQEKIIFTDSAALLTLANKQMPMSGSAYMDASVATP